jgi:hypothetical protein
MDPLSRPSLHLLGRSVRITTELVSIRLRLRRILHGRPLPAVLSALTPRRPPRSKIPLPIVDRGIQGAEDILSHLRIVPDSCLYRSLARYAIFQRAGHPVRFVMGIQPAADELTGHAWIELDGSPYDEDVDPGMRVTFAYPAGLEAA